MANSTALSNITAIVNETIAPIVVPVVAPTVNVIVPIMSEWSHWFIFGTAIFGLFWGTVQIF